MEGRYAGYGRERGLAEVNSWVCAVEYRDVVGIVNVWTWTVKVSRLSIRRKLYGKPSRGHDVGSEER